MDSREKSLLRKCIKNIDWIEDYNPDPSDRKRHGVVFVCSDNDDEEFPYDCIMSRLVVAIWDGEDWLEWVGREDGENHYRGPVENVVAWSWLE